MPNLQGLNKKIGKNVVGTERARKTRSIHPAPTKNTLLLQLYLSKWIFLAEQRLSIESECVWDKKTH